MEVIQFPSADPLAFDGMGIKIDVDVEKQRKNWAAIFAIMKSAAARAEISKDRALARAKRRSK
jgi:hypothetical protein